MGRRVDLDAFRGVLLLLMALTHLPTRASAYASQLFGFVSAAEGFVFLSAFLASAGYLRLLRDQGAWEARRKAWKRAAQLYGCHLGLLLFTFTVVAGIALATGRPALSNLLSFYFVEPAWALFSALLLVYQPPLLDILPMYVVFMAITPLALETAHKRGWPTLLSLSFSLWLLAQFDARGFVYQGLSLSGWPVPIEALGAFDWFAWQLLWIVGLWLGACAQGWARCSFVAPCPRYIVVAAFIAALVFFSWRHQMGGLWAGLGDEFRVLDKWHLGPVRLLNFAALAILVRAMVLPIFARLRIRILSLLGRASLPVFIAHLLVSILALALIVDDTVPLSLTQEVGVLAFALTSMLWVALRAAHAPREQGVKPVQLTIR